MVTIQSESVSNFRNNYNVILQRLSKGPVLLLQYSNVAGVLISKDEWNAIVERIEDLEDTVAVWKYRYEQAIGTQKTVPFDLADYIADEEVARVSR